MKRKLSPEQLEELERRAVKAYIPHVPKTKFWTLDDLAKGRMFSQSAIKKCVSNAQNRRLIHKTSGWNGWTKNKSMRSEVRMPVALYLQPEIQKRYFPEGADEHEKNKALERLKKDFPAFKTHD